MHLPVRTCVKWRCALSNDPFDEFGTGDSSLCTSIQHDNLVIVIINCQKFSKISLVLLAENSNDECMVTHALRTAALPVRRSIRLFFSSLFF